MIYNFILAEYPYYMATALCLRTIFRIGTIAFPIIFLTLYPLTKAGALIFLTNSTSIVDSVASKQLKIYLGVSSSSIAIGDTQHIRITVGEANSSHVISGARITGAVVNSANSRQALSPGQTDNSGSHDYILTIGPQSRPGIYSVGINASATGYQPASAAMQFQVKKR